MFLLYQYLEGSPKKLTIQPTLLGSATQFPRSKSRTSNNWRSLQCLWRIIVGLNSPFSFLGNPHIFLDHIPIILGQYVHLVLPNPHDITATCWATCPYFGQTFHFCQEIRCFFRGLPWFFLWPSAQTSNLLRTNSPMEELREEVESNDDYHGHHHKIRYFYDCDICTIYTINLCVFFFCFSNKPVTFWDGGNLSPTRCFWVKKWLGHLVIVKRDTFSSWFLGTPTFQKHQKITNGDSLSNMTSGRKTSWAFKQLVKVLGGHVQQLGDYSTSAYNNTEWQWHNPELLAKLLGFDPTIGLTSQWFYDPVGLVLPNARRIWATWLTTMRTVSGRGHGTFFTQDVEIWVPGVSRGTTTWRPGQDVVFVGSAFAFNRQSLATCAHLFQGPPRRFFSFGTSISSGEWFFAASCIWDIHFDIHFDIYEYPQISSVSST